MPLKKKRGRKKQVFNTAGEAAAQVFSKKRGGRSSKIDYEVAKRLLDDNDSIEPTTSTTTTTAHQQPDELDEDKLQDISRDSGRHDVFGEFEDDEFDNVYNDSDGDVDDLL